MTNVRHLLSILHRLQTSVLKGFSVVIATRLVKLKRCKISFDFGLGDCGALTLVALLTSLNKTGRNDFRWATSEKGA